MSLMATSGPRPSTFTFESTAHSSHVLRRLDEQRRRDVLCDVTVVVRGQSFRAHRAVLASCSEYFTDHVSSLTQRGEVVTLPPEVTVDGFEPLLKFAYTSKLLFGKDNALEIRNSASILGFRDLDEACFEFLLPKFISTSNGCAPFPRKTCCKKKVKRRLSKEDCGIHSDNVLLDEKEVKPVADSPPQQEVAWHSDKSVNSKMGSQNNASTLTPVAAGTNVHAMQCPKYRKFQLACGKETCVAEKSLSNLVSVIKDDCNLSGSHCCSTANSSNTPEAEFHGKSFSNPTRQDRGAASEPWKTETHDMKREEHMGRGGALVNKDKRGKWSEREDIMRDMDITEAGEEIERCTALGFSKIPNVKAGCSELCPVPRERSPGLMLYQCPLKALAEGPSITGSLGQESAVNITGDKKTRDFGEQQRVTVHQKREERVKAEEGPAREEMDVALEGKRHGRGIKDQADPQANDNRERGTVEREVAEHLATRLGSSKCFYQLDPQDNDAGGSPDAGSRAVPSTSSECPRVATGATGASCPLLLQNAEQGKCLWRGNASSECEGASQSGLSSFNSGEDGDSETEGDSESYTRERARQVQLPFSVKQIVDLSRNEFQQLLKDQVFTQEQLDFVHDMRRRSKNRLAAQRCRKRKLDCIYNLQCEIINLKMEREKLMMEKSQLSQQKLKTCHSVSALCQRVCSEANLQPEQLQVLAKYTSPDCPLASIFPHIDSLLSQPGLSLHAQALLSTCLADFDECGASGAAAAAAAATTAAASASSGSRWDAVAGDCQHSGSGKAP